MIDLAALIAVIDWRGVLFVAIVGGGWTALMYRGYRAADAATKRRHERQQAAHDARAMLEPGAAAIYGPEVDPAVMISLSSAISLKRIADVMCPDEAGLKPSILLALHDIEANLRGRS